MKDIQLRYINPERYIAILYETHFSHSRTIKCISSMATTFHRSEYCMNHISGQPAIKR